MDNCKLKVRFPRLFNNSLSPDSPLYCFGKWHSDKWSWEFKWRREWFEWEKPQVDEFIYVLEGQTLKSGWDDKWLWRDPQSCKYSVKSTYEILSSLTLGASSDTYTVLWGLLIPPSTQCFAWRALQDKIATKKNLLRRSVHLVDHMCALCWSKEEKTSHLLLSCPIANVVWNS